MLLKLNFVDFPFILIDFSVLKEISQFLKFNFRPFFGQNWAKNTKMGKINPIIQFLVQIYPYNTKKEKSWIYGWYTCLDRMVKMTNLYSVRTCGMIGGNFFHAI